MRSTCLLSLFFCLLGIGVSEAMVAGKGPAYVVGQSSGSIYSVDLNTGSYSQLLTIPGASLADIAILNNGTAYAIAQNDGSIYSINLKTAQYRQITSIGSGTYAIQLLNNNTAVATNINTHKVSEIELNTGANRVIATLPALSQPVGIDVANESLVYTAGYNSDKMYAVNLSTGQATIIASLVNSGEAWGVALQDSTTGYVVIESPANIMRVNLTNGQTSLVSPTTIPAFTGIALNGNTAYITNTETIYVVNLANGSYTTLANIPGENFYGIALLLQIPTTNLSATNFQVANYLNQEAPINVIRSLAILNSGLPTALEAVSPLRNSLSTFAAQNAFLASSQIFIDHMHNKRLLRGISRSSLMTSRQLEQEEEYIAGPIQFKKRRKVEEKKEEETPPKKKERNSYTAWATPFGEYTRERGGGGLPKAEMGSGGVVVGFDFNLQNKNSVGIAGAYIYTHLHESAGMGNAKINQGYLTAYGEMLFSDWYLDLGIWGGYYSSKNRRFIQFPGVSETAHATIQGGQLAPHFEVGYDGFLSAPDKSEWLGIEPFLLADWVADWENSFKETGAGNYNMGQKARFCSLFRGETGVRFQQALQMKWGAIFFTEKTSYAYQKAFHTGRVTAFLIGSPGSFTVEALQNAQNLGVVELSLSFSPKSSKIPYFDLRYQGEFGSRYQSHQGMLEIGKSF